MLDFLGTLTRTHTCGELRASDAGKQVVLLGWVNRRRDHGNLIFLDLRDRYGITQVVMDNELSAAAHAKAEQARPEYVVAAIGKVRLRGKDVINPKMATGEIEVVAEELRILNDAKVPPFSPAEEAIGNEEVRLKYRYIDLRRPEMQKNFEIRHKVALAVREYLSSQGFLEIETPFMTRSTPEGARDYLVPSRVHPGEFYALPQSPQLFKQILMISGMDRYFQIARCFRDEDLRADRQPEFTQIDLEMTFPQQETVFAVVEGFLKAAFEITGEQISAPFPRMTYDEAIRRYGIDKPDLRLPAMVDLTEELTPELRTALKIEQGLPVLGFTIPRVGELSGTARKALTGDIRASLGDSGLDVLDVARLRTSETFAGLAEKITEMLSGELKAFDQSALCSGRPECRDYAEARDRRAGEGSAVDLQEGWRSSGSTWQSDSRTSTAPSRRKVPQTITNFSGSPISRSSSGMSRPKAGHLRIIPLLRRMKTICWRGAWNRIRRRCGRWPTISC